MAQWLRHHHMMVGVGPWASCIYINVQTYISVGMGIMGRVLRQDIARIAYHCQQVDLGKSVWLAWGQVRQAARYQRCHQQKKIACWSLKVGAFGLS